MYDAIVSAIVVRRVGPSDSTILRLVRLRALETDPAFFFSKHEVEAAFPDPVWAERAERSSAGDDITTLLAIRSDEPVGLVTASRDVAQRHLFHVFSMWVAPDARRDGVGRTLLNEIEGWIVSCGGTGAHLSVYDVATAAKRLYESAGYKPDDSSVESRDAPGPTQISLLKQLQ